MLIIYLTLIGVIAVLLILAGIWMISAQSQGDRTRRWILFLLASSIILAAPLAVFADGLRTSSSGLVLILEIPALIGILTLLLINGHRIFDRWQEEIVLVSGLLFALLMLLVVITFRDPYLLLILLLPALILAGIWLATRRLELGGLVAISLGVLVLIILDAVGVMAAHFVLATSWLWVAYKIVSILILFLALTLSALLVDRSLENWSANNPKGSLAFMTLAALLVLSMAAATLRHGILTNATARAAEDHLPIGVVAVAVMVGLLLTFGLKQRHTRAGPAFSLLVPLLIAVAYSAGWFLNPLAITAKRAEQINQAVLAHYQELNTYPENLSELSPEYLPFILGPLTGRGQVWCYRSGEGYYQLGYIIYQRYYGPTLPEPHYEIKIVDFAGQTPGEAWMCDEELELMKDTGGL
jgi:hypothetical protein